MLGYSPASIAQNFTRQSVLNKIAAAQAQANPYSYNLVVVSNMVSGASTSVIQNIPTIENCKALAKSASMHPYTVDAYCLAVLKVPDPTH